jgi:hypothetical protein
VTNKSQIATIITFIIAVVFLFIVITINIGRVSQRKTLIDNSCDAAGLLLASSLGSVASALKQQLEIYGSTHESCSPNWNLIIGIALIIGGIIGAVFSGGGTLGLIVLAASILGYGYGAYMVASDIAFAAYTEPGLMKEMQAKFQNMTAEQKLFEAAIQYTLFTTIDDSSFVPDRFDADRDGQKYPARLDKIPRFNHWYFQRLNTLPRVGELVEEFFNYLFTSPPQFRVVENPESWDAEGATLLVNGNWGAADWLRDQLKPFTNELWTYGFGVDFASDYRQANIEEEEDDLGRLYKDIRAFEEFVATGIYNQSKDKLIESLETWFPQFYNGSGSDDWYDRMGEWITLLNNWITLLRQRHDQVLSCANSCSAAGPYVCGGGGGECCTSHDVYCCDEYGCWVCDCVCDANCGCAGSRGCCQLCPSGHCRPTANCNTPTGGSRACCDSGCSLYVQSCAAGSYSTGGGGSCAGPCTDTYYNCGCSNHTRIEPYIPYLQQFVSSIQDFRTRILSVQNRITALKNNPWTYRAIYIWKDRALSEVAGAQENPAHLVYVRIEPDSDFKFPYVTQRRAWLGFMICKSIGGASGEFNITLARYDEDTAKQGPLRDFWRFKFRRGAGNEAATLATIRAAADRFYNRLDSGESCVGTCFDNNLITSAQADTLGNFAYNNGIAAKIRVHYGPGLTYRPEELPGEAVHRNEEIYIVRRYK